jgi:membrane protein implicated in regulation of membrane protease activity
MSEWWNSLLIGQQIFFLIALPSTLVLLLQTILLLLGVGDDDADVDADFDSDVTGDDGLAIFSVRGVLSMLCIMGWSGFALLTTPLHPVASILISVALGILTLFGIAYLMRSINRLQSSGNLQISNAIGKVGQVYIPIPGGAAAAGKINLTVQEQYREFSAITLQESELKTGVYVRVVAVDDAGTLVVEPVAKSSAES